MFSRRAAAFLVVLAPPLAARADQRDDIAQKYAPVIYQETHDAVKDLYAAFDFDGNWNGDDNSEDMQCWYDPAKCVAAGCAGQKCPLVATVYYTVIETRTHWFVQYMPYHPLDWKLTNGHEHDTESVLAVVAKLGSHGTLQAIETRFHNSWFDYAADGRVTGAAGSVDGPVHYEPVSGHPAVYSQMVGHGLCGGFSPPNYFFPDLQLSCDHAAQPHIETTGVIYRSDLAAAMPTVIDKTTVTAGYAMVELFTSVWPHIKEIGAGKAFKTAIDFQGERCNTLTCPKQIGGAWEGDEGQSPGEPWAQVGGSGVSADGDQFFDPAYTMGKRLAFPPPYSLEYCWNPYLDIVSGCADPSDLGLSDGPSDAALQSGDAARVPDGAGSDGPGAMMAVGCGCGLGAPLVAARTRLVFLLLLGGLLVVRRMRR